MRALLDTHVFLWWITDDRRLSQRVRRLFRDPRNELLLSAASAWEIAIKARAGDLKIEGDVGNFVREHLAANAIGVLPVQLDHALGVATLPRYHGDPFDRLIVAQSQAEKLPIVTGDKMIRRYAVEVLW